MASTLLSCSSCGVIACRSADEARYPKYCLTAQTDPAVLDEAFEAYGLDDASKRIAQVAAGIEGEFHGRMTRVEETLEFINRMGYKKIGIATCVGLLGETKVFSKILTARQIDHYVAGCKVGAIDKSEIGIPDTQKLNGGCGHESMCNPILQARLLAEHGTDFNIVIGLCVGHDVLFLQNSAAPATVLIVKDRVLGHSPVTALYTATGAYSRFKAELAPPSTRRTASKPVTRRNPASTKGQP
jgi:uncharacterized metal-binding protein